MASKKTHPDHEEPKAPDIRPDLREEALSSLAAVRAVLPTLPDPNVFGHHLGVIETALRGGE